MTAASNSMRHREQPVTKRVTRYLVMAPTDLSTPTHPMGVWKVPGASDEQYHGGYVVVHVPFVLKRVLFRACLSLKTTLKMCFSLQSHALGRQVYIRRVDPRTQVLCSVRVYVVAT